VALSTEEKIKIVAHACDIIPTPEQWTVGFFARKANSVGVDIRNPEAVMFCARGAISKSLSDLGYKDWLPDGDNEYEVSEFVSHTLGYGYDLGTWNNINDHATVLAGFKKVAQIAA